MKMEIDAVAKYNGCTLHQRKKPKVAIFSDLKESVPTGNGSLTKDRYTRKDSSVIESLLAVSETADSDFYRQLVRKRPSGDQLGPWLFHNQWMPRKRPSQSRRGKRCSNSNLSPTRLMSTNTNCNEKVRLRFRHEKTAPTTVSSDGLCQREDHQTRADDTENVQMNDGSRGTGMSPTMAPRQDSVYQIKEHDAQVLSIGTVDTKDVSQTYPKHSLPTLITLKPADSNNRYDAVFSLGKSDLSSQEILQSMGPANRLPSSIQRQTKWPLEAKDQKLHVESSTGKGAGCQHFKATSPERMSVSNGRSKSVEAFGSRRRQSTPPMCEHNDISLHMRHYRMNHTVRFTGRFSLANDVPEQKEVKAVQWKDVFPHRPFSSTISSTAEVPVFRFSVSDFQKEPLVMEREGSREPTESTPMARKDMDRVSARRTASRLEREPLPVGTEIAKRNATTKDTKVSLSPTVTPVVRSQRMSLTPNTTDGTDSWTSRGDQKTPQSTHLPSEFEERRHVDSNVSGEVTASSYYGGGYEEPNQHGANDDRTRANLSQGPDDNFRKSEECPREDFVTTKGGANDSDVYSKLSKTKAYIQSSFSVYNDTIRQVASPQNTKGVDYREYLKRKNWQRNSFDCKNVNDTIGCCGSILPECEDQTMTSRFKSPNKFSSILKDIMGLSVSKTLDKNLESKRDGSFQWKQINHTRPSQSARVGNSASRSSLESPSKIEPLLSIDTKQLRDSVERKVQEGTPIIPRPLTSRSVEFSGGFIRFLVRDGREQKTSLLPRENTKNSHQEGHDMRAMYVDGEIGTRRTKSFPDKMSGKNLRTASTYDLNADCDISLTEPSTGNGSQSCGERYVPNETFMNKKKVWRPSASRWNRKPSNNPDSRPASSAFHYNPTSSTPSAFVIATPPPNLGFDDRGVVLPLDDFVRMAMKSRESSFSALSQSVNAGCKVGIATNTKTGARPTRKSSDDGLVRVVSFATPVNQFIFAKRITGYPSTSALVSSDLSLEANTAEDAGRSVFQREMDGSFRLSLKSAGERKPCVNGDSLKRFDPGRKNVGVETNEGGNISGKYLSVKEETDKKHGSSLLGGTSNVTENQSIHRKIKVDMCNLLKQVDYDDVFERDDNRGIEYESNLDKASSKDKRKSASAMRKRITRLAEMKSTNDMANKMEESDVTDFSTGQDKLLHAPSCTAKNSENRDLRDYSVDYLASKVSQLRQRKKKVLRRNNITKQIRLVHKSFPDHVSDETVTSLKTQSADGMMAKGHTPWKDNIMRREPPGRPKTVRFACDNTGVADPIHYD